jgi:preprotein translocase subunit Sec61beta
MADSGINVPSGFGGLVKFKEEYESKFNLKPMHVILFVILILVFRVALPLFVK